MSKEDAAPESTASEEETPARERPARAGRSFTALLLAAGGLTAVLAGVLFPIFVGLGLGGAPYWAVAVAVIGGIVMRRALLTNPSVTRTVLFSAVAIGGALAGLAVANLFLS